jgi:hypothetical protein
VPTWRLFAMVKSANSVLIKDGFGKRNIIYRIAVTANTQIVFVEMQCWQQLLGQGRCV